MNQEIWKDIQGYEGLYQVSSLGNVKSLARTKNVAKNGGCYNLGDINLKFSNKRGYKGVTFCVNGITKSFSVHRLVAAAFLENKKNKKTVNHINGIKGDNRCSNLEWVNQSEQQIHAVSIGLRKNAIGEKCNLSKLKVEDVLKIRDLYSTGLFSCEEVANKLNTSKKSVSDIIRGLTWKHLGFNNLISTKKKVPDARLFKLVNYFPSIWHLYYINNMNYTQIASIFGCYKTTISRIINQKDKHLTYYNNAQYKQSL